MGGCCVSSYTLVRSLLIGFGGVCEFFWSGCMSIWCYSWVVCIVFYHDCVPVVFLPPGQGCEEVGTVLSGCLVV